MKNNYLLVIASVFLLLSVSLVMFDRGVFLSDEDKEIKFYSEVSESWVAPEWFTASDGDVYINDSRAYIRSQDNTNNPIIEIMSKQYTGKVNVVFGFNTDEYTPKRLEYNPRLKNVSKSYTCNGDFNYTINPKHIWCYNTYTDEYINGTIYNLTRLVFERDFDSGDLSSKTVYWSEVETVWTDVSGGFTKIKRDLQGFDTWYYKKDVSIVAGEMNTLRLKLQPKNINSGSNKYWIGIYPSSLSFQQAVIQDKLYALDPWTASLSVNLISYYNFDENTGIVAEDVTGNGYNLTGFNTPGWTSSGKIGNATDLNGASTERWLNNDGELALNMSFSINAWSTADSYTSGAPIVQLTTEQNSGIYRVKIDLVSANEYKSGSRYTGVWSFLGGSTVTGTDWNMITYVINETGNSMYVNGVHTDYMTNSTVLEDFVDYVGLSIGARSQLSTFDKGWDGKIDEVGVWSNRALTQSDIDLLYNGGAGITFSTGITNNPPNIDSPLPLNDTNFTVSTVNFNATVYDDIKLVNVSLKIDGSIMQTNTSGTNNSIYLFTELGLSNGQHNWSIIAYDNNSISNESETRTFNITVLAPIVLSNSPIDGFNTTFPFVDFNVTINNNTQVIANVSILFDDIINQTNTSGLDGDYLWNISLGEGTTKWEVLVCDTDNDCSSSAERNVNIDTIKPIINLTSPLPLENYKLINTNEIFNWTVTEDNLDVCIYEYLGVNNTVICGDNTTTISITGYTDYTIRFFVNDTFGNSAIKDINWSYKVLEINQTFDSTNIEGSIEDFSANIRLNDTITISSATFTYNGADTSASAFPSGDNTTISITDFVIPGVTGQTNITFNWTIVLSDASIINLQNNNVTVSDLGLDNCSVFTNNILNFSVVDEKTQLVLPNASVEIDVDIFSSDRSSNLINLSFEFDNVNPVGVCLENPIPTGVEFSLDSVVKYSEINHSIEYYNIKKATLDDSFSQNITLFDLHLDENTDFSITFKDSDFVVVEGATINVDRQYVSEGTFKTVEIPLTDSNGQTVVHLVRNDVVYNFLVKKDGIIIGSFNSLIAFCDDATIGACFIPLNAKQGTLPPYDYDSSIGLASTTKYNSTTRVITFDFVTTDSTVKTIKLIANKSDQIGNISVCNEQIISSSGTLTCTVPPSLGNSSLFINILVDSKSVITQYINLGNDLDLGFEGLFIMMFMLISVSLMFTDSKSMLIIGVITSFIAGSLLYFSQGEIVGIGSNGAVSAIIWLSISGGIIIWKLTKEVQA